MARLDDFRRKYPEYDDVPDQQLADALHSKYYSDVPLDQYYSQLGLASEPVDPIAPEDDTTALGALGEFGKRALGGIGTGAVRAVSGLGQLIPGVSDQSMIDMEMGARRSISDALDYDPAYDENFIAQLGEVAGEMVPQIGSLFVPGGALVKGATSVATVTGQAVSEGGMDRAEYEARTGEALTDAQRLTDKSRDILLGTLERYGVDRRILKGLPKGFFQTAEGNPILRRIESMVMSGLSEGTQETAQGILRDITTKAIYDPDRAIADSAVEDFTLGGGAGALFDFIISSVTGGNRRTRKVEAPKEITEPTEDQIAEEERARAEKLEQEAARVATKDAELAAAREPSVAPDPISSVSIDPELDTEEIVTEIQRRQSVPAGAMFEVEGRDGTYIVSQNGNQFGPAMKDPIKAQEVKARLSEESDNLRVDAVVDAHIERMSRGERPDQPSITNLQRMADRGVIDQAVVDDMARRQAATTQIGPQERQRLDNQRGRIKSFYRSVRDAGRRFSPEEPTKPRLEPQRATAEPAPVVNLMERRLDTALNRKGIANRINSKEGSGVVQTIVGRPVSESKPLSDLTRSEMDYVLQAIEQAPQVTTPRGTGVDQVDPVTGVTVPSRPRMIGPEAAIFIPNFADVAKPAQPEVRTEPVEKGKELALFDPDAEAKAVDRQLESAVNKQVQDILKSVGIDGDYAAKIVNQVGTASRDSAGNVYITPPEKPQTGEITTMGSAQAGAKVIQIALDGVKQRVDQGMSFEEATAMVMNHELVHALRAMDLFTAQEFSLLERLTRQYGKPGTNQTYAQWAVSTYATRKDPETGQEVPQDAVIQQEEAIAEMLSDAMTKGVLIDGDVRKVGGKPQNLIRRIINLFKRLVGYARDNDIDSYKQLVNRIQSGEVGARERGVVRTLMQTEKNLGEVQERAVTTEDLQLVTGTRPTQEQITAIAANLKEQVGQMVADNPELDPNIGKRAIDTPDEVLESRIARAAEQRFRVNIPYYHGTSTDPLIDGGVGIRRFQGRLGMGVVAGHFTENVKFANVFAPQVMTYQREYPVVYPVFLRYGEDNEVGGLFEVRSAIQDEGNPVSRSINRTLNNQPELKASLEGYFASELEKGKLLGPDATRLKSFEQADIARFFYEGAMKIEEASERLAEDFHNRVAPQTYAMIAEDPYGIDFTQLEPLAPYMKEAGFVGYYDIERPGGPYSAVAMFNSEDIKGMFARFDPESVPEGSRYEDDIMYSRKRVGTTGQYVGAPKGVDTPAKLGSLIRTVRALAEEGEYGRFWYERSGRQILELVGGDKKEAEKLVQAIAITSPMTPVPTNFQYALQAYYQNKAGQPIKTGMFSKSVSEDLENMFKGVPWEGRKTNNFYINLMREIDPTLVQGVTNDMWMMRAFQQFTDSPTPAQYDFVESETKRLAEELGWEPQQVQAAIWVALKSRMQSKPVKREVDRTSEAAGYIRFDTDPRGKRVRVILDGENHRKNWFRTALEYTPTLQEREDAKFDYADAASASTAQSSWESVPSRSSGHMNQIFQSPMNQRLDYHKQISMAMLDNDGNDIIARDLEILSPGAFEAPGFFEGETSPGSQTRIVLPKKYKATGATEVEPAALDLMDAYSATVGILLKQDGVGYHRPFFVKNLSRPKANGLDVDIGRPLTTEEMVEVGKIYMEETGDPYASPVSTSQGFRLINFDDSVDNKTFQLVAERVLGKVDLPDFVATRFASQNGYLGNNWTENLNGEGYLQDGRLAGRPDLQRRVRDLVTKLTPRIEAVEAEFTQKYGWQPNTALNAEYSTRPKYSDARSGSANSPDYEQTISGAVTPEGKLSITHYARREIDQTDPSLAGTGADRTKRNRPTIGTWFGLTGADIDPYIKEPMLGNVPNEFFVDPSRIYVIEDRSNPSAPTDPEKVWTQYPDGKPNYEQIGEKVKKLGFDGYLINAPALGKVVVMHTPLTKQGADDVMESRAPLRSIDPAKIEKAVAQNQQEAERAGTTVPLYSVKASPEAQYIARNPEAAVVPDEILESRDPEYRPETKSFIGRLVTDRPERVDPMQQYMDATGDNSPLSYKLTKARQAILNRYARLEKLNQKYFNNYLADSSSIAAVLFADRSAGVTAEAFKSGVPQYKNGLTKVVDFSHNGKKYRGLIDIIDLLRTKKYGDLTQFAQAYAIAMRGKRLNDNGKVTPVTDADYQQALRDVEQYTDANGNNPVKEWYGAWQAYNNQVITFLQDTGVLNEQTAEDWRLAADYIPYYRALDPEAEIGKVVTNAYGDLRKLGAFKAYKGKTDKINVPLVEAITKNVGSAIDLGMRNVAQQRIARDMQKLQLATQVPASRKNDAAVIGFKVRGEPVYFQIHDPLILESMSAIESSGLENLSRMYFGPFSSLLRETVTRTPGFMIANLLRDSLSAFVTSGARFLPWIDTTKGYFQDVNRLERTGVVGGYDFSVDQKDLGELFEEESANRKRRGLPLNILRTMWRFAGRQTTRSDAATRQAVYNDVYSRTGNEAEAHYQAMEILNFSRRGSNGVMRAIATAVPFLNARIQGLDVLYRGALGVNPANRELTQNRAIIGFAMRGALLGFATALYWAQVSDEEEYREASRELKDNNWLFPVPWLEDVGAIAIPIPFEVGLIFKTIPEVVLDTGWGERTGKQAFESGKQAVLSTLNFNPVPQALTPVLEAITNYDVYTGRAIVPVWMTGQRPEMQRTDATTELALLLQKATIPFGGGGASPMKIDHIIRGYTGGTGVFVTSWLDRIVRDPTVTEGLDAIGYTVKQPEMSALATYDYPVVKRFLTSPEGTGLKEQFYDLYNEVRQDYNSMNALIRDGRQDELDALIPKIGYLAEVKDGIYSLKKELDNIRMMRRGIMRSDLDAEMKKEQLDALREYENDILSVTPLLESLANRSVIRGL